MSDQPAATRTPQKKGSVIIDAERCKGCGICTVICNRNVLANSQQLNRKGYTPVEAVRPDNCTACTLCAVMCPDAAIRVYRQKAARNG